MRVEELDDEESAATGIGVTAPTTTPKPIRSLPPRQRRPRPPSATHMRTTPPSMHGSRAEQDADTDSSVAYDDDDDDAPLVVSLQPLGVTTTMIVLLFVFGGLVERLLPGLSGPLAKEAVTTLSWLMVATKPLQTHLQQLRRPTTRTTRLAVSAAMLAVTAVLYYAMAARRNQWDGGAGNQQGRETASSPMLPWVHHGLLACAVVLPHALGLSSAANYRTFRPGVQRALGTGLVVAALGVAILAVAIHQHDQQSRGYYDSPPGEPTMERSSAFCCYRGIFAHAQRPDDTGLVLVVLGMGIVHVPALLEARGSTTPTGAWRRSFLRLVVTVVAAPWLVVKLLQVAANHRIDRSRAAAGYGLDLVATAYFDTVPIWWLRPWRKFDATPYLRIEQAGGIAAVSRDDLETLGTPGIRAIYHTWWSTGEGLPSSWPKDSWHTFSSGVDETIRPQQRPRRTRDPLPTQTVSARKRGLGSDPPRSDGPLRSRQKPLDRPISPGVRVHAGQDGSVHRGMQHTNRERNERTPRGSRSSGAGDFLDQHPNVDVQDAARSSHESRESTHRAVKHRADPDKPTVMTQSSSRLTHDGEHDTSASVSGATSNRTKTGPDGTSCPARTHHPLSDAAIQQLLCIQRMAALLDRDDGEGDDIVTAVLDGLKQVPAKLMQRLQRDPTARTNALKNPWQSIWSLHDWRNVDDLFHGGLNETGRAAVARQLRVDRLVDLSVVDIERHYFEDDMDEDLISGMTAWIKSLPSVVPPRYERHNELWMLQLDDL